MDLKSLFNILLLSLSLATVLVTLVSYLLYKLRQLAIKGQHKDVHRLDGVFFTRYAPHLEKINQQAREKAQTTHRKKSYGVSLGALFAIVIGVIATSLFAETYFVELQERKKKIAVAENYRALVDQGLLRRYDYTPKIDIDNLKAWVSPAQKSIQRYLITQLKTKKITLGLSKHDTEQAKNALEPWFSFFKANELQFQTKPVVAIANTDLLILPYSEILDQSEKTALEQFMSRGGGVIASGLLAKRNGLMQETDGSWAKQYFGIEFSKCPDERKFPTLFSVEQFPQLSIPIGYESPWFPTDSANCAYTIDDKAVVTAFEANYDGQIRLLENTSKSAIVRAVLKQNGQSRAGWMAFVPAVVQENLQSADSFYRNQVLLSSLAWVSGIPLFKIADWPHGATRAVTVSVVAGKLEGILKRFIALLQKNYTPFTLFISSKEIEPLKEVLSGVSLEKIELAARFDLINPQANPSSQLNRIDFKEIEKNRLDLEEQSAQAVHGISIASGSFNQSVHFSALVNRLQYLLGSEYGSGLSLSIYHGLPFLSIPAPSSISENEGRYLASQNPASSVQNFNPLAGQLEVRHFDQINSESLLELENFINDLKIHPKWTANFRQLYDWIVKRDQLDIEINAEVSTNPEKFIYKVTIANFNDLPVENLSVVMDLAQFKAVKIIGTNLQADAIRLEGNRSISIKSIPKKTKFDLALEVTKGTNQ